MSNNSTTNLIYDRTAADLSNGSKKGEWNPDDMNRVEKWCEYFCQALSSAGYNIWVTTKTNWSYEDLRSAADMERVRDNIKKIRAAFSSAKDGITQVLPSAESFDWKKANNWEQVLDEINTYLDALQSNFIHAGVGNAGQPRIYQQRFRPAYTPITSISTYGVQYINTGVVGAVKVVMEADLINLWSNELNAILWAENGSAPYKSNGLRTDRRIDGYTNRLTIGCGSTFSDTIEARGRLFEFSTDPDDYYLKIDGETILSGTNVGGELTSYPLYLFANNQAGTAKHLSSIKLYSCKIYQNNVLIRDFIPVLYGTEKCLYDRANGQYYFNQGSGTFN